MKAVMIIYNQAHSSSITEAIEKCGVRGFTKWVDVQGRGSVDGEPHYGSHAWPSKNMVIIAIVQEEKIAPLQQELEKIDKGAPRVGLRLFVWEADVLL